MSKKHHYTNYAAIKPNQVETPVVETETVAEVIAEVTEVAEVPVVEDVVTEPAIVEPVAEPKKLIGVVADCDRLNVRKGPSKMNTVVGTLTKDTKVTIENEIGDFYEISTPDVKGYCMKQYIKTTY